MLEISYKIHPTAVGRNFKNPVCPQGHNKKIVGVVDGGCRACRLKRTREWNETSRKPYSYRKKYCKRGHYKPLVGVWVTGACAECRRQEQRRKRRAKKPGPRSVRLSCYVPHLKKVRESLDLSVSELAQKSGISPQAIYSLEAEKRRATPQTQAKLLSVIAPLLTQRKYEEMGL